MDDRKALIWTAWASIAMAAVAAVALPISCAQNAKMLSVSQGALDTANGSLEQQRVQFAEERHFLQQSADKARRDQQVQQANFERERRDESARTTDEQHRWERDTAERAKLSYEARSPYLIQHQCCNPVQIEVVTNPDGRRFVRPTTVLPDGHLLTPQVMRIINIGQGAALRVKAVWQTESVIGSNFDELPIQPGDDGGKHTIPFVIKAGEESAIQHFPQFYVDADGRFALVKGCLELICVDTADYSHRFRYDFTMNVVLESQTTSDATPATVYIDVSENERDREPELEPTPVSPLGSR